MAKERILVVEDEPLVGEEIREDLERLGYLVPEILVSGDAIVEAIERTKPDLVLMDIKLEGAIDGIEAAFRAKAEYSVPIIYLTAYSDAATLARAAQTSPSSYLLKPFNERELAANVAMALSSSRSKFTIIERLRGSAPLVDALELPALLLDSGGLILHANLDALALLKVEELAALRNEPLSRFIDIGANDATLSPWKTPPERQLLLIAADGSAKNVVVRIEPLASASGGDIGSLVVFDSMSGRERGLLETSAHAINEAILESLAGPGAAGPNFTVAGFLVPCPTGSGDLFDVFPVDERHFCFFGIDVMGHGPFASLIAWSLRDLIRRVVAEAGASALRPEEILARVNMRYRQGSFGSESFFFSAMLGIVERGTGRFVAGRAGHPPYILLNPGRPAESIQGAGRAIGFSDKLDVVEMTGTLEAGGRLVLFSDGLLAAYEKLGLDLEALVKLVDSRRETRLSDFSEELESGVRDGFAGDDASLLAIERV
jgi:CheY-like chemotaxis protein